MNEITHQLSIYYNEKNDKELLLDVTFEPYFHERNTQYNDSGCPVGMPYFDLDYIDFAKAELNGKEIELNERNEKRVIELLKGRENEWIEKVSEY